MGKRKRRGIEALEELAAHVAAVLMTGGLEANLAQGLAQKTVDRVRASWGGYEFYFPRGRSADVDAMRQAIYARWTGSNTRALCDEYHISERRLRQLYDEARRETIGAPACRDVKSRHGRP